MNKEIRLALLCLAAAAVPAFAQEVAPQCGAFNYDQSRNLYTVFKAAPGALNQQCFLTVYAQGAAPSAARQSPASYLPEGRYIIELSGGGGGGGGGRAGPQEHGGGGGGAGATVAQVVQYLAPGVYRLTIGTGGSGGHPNGGSGTPGNPTNLTEAYTGQLIAGFAGADTWSGTRIVESGSDGGLGGVAAIDGGSGGNGAGGTVMAQADGMLPLAGFSGMPAKGGRNALADIGDLGGGGSGGHGGVNVAEGGGNGGNGYIRLIPLGPDQ